MCGSRPCFKSVFGLDLATAVIIIGVLELLVTIIATVLNVVKYSEYYEAYREECEDKDVCIGPLIKYTVFDAFFGVLCSVILITGAHLRSKCLIITWICFTLVASVKYIWIVITRDWTSLEDWISITYLLFYMMVFTIVLSLLTQINTTPGTSAPAFSQPYNGAGSLPHSVPQTTRVVINQTFVPQPTPQREVVTTPTNYPGNPHHHPPPYSQQETTSYFMK